ncbi:MAG: stage II sporulation protein R [Velocimicrobium sp.]
MNSKFILYFFFLFLLLASPNKKSETVNIASQEHIASQIIRLHVIANSDSTEDQALKLLVKNDIVLFLREQLNTAQTITEARKIIQDNLSSIEEVAATSMANNGYFYSVKASLSFCDFPIKQYGDLIFPAGRYEALRVELGTSKGKNWWCVMFPSLCYVDETYEVITEENKEKFKEILTKEEYESLLSDENTPVFYKSKLKELFDKVIDYFPIKE